MSLFSMYLNKFFSASFISFISTPEKYTSSLTSPNKYRHDILREELRVTKVPRAK